VIFLFLGISSKYLIIFHLCYYAIGIKLNKTTKVVKSDADLIDFLDFINEKGETKWNDIFQ